jgi:hypothetical protein
MKTLSKKQVIGLRSGQMVYSVWGQLDNEKEIKWSVRCQFLTGKRKHLEGWLNKANTHLAHHILNGSVGDKFFFKKKHAEAFVEQLKKGFYIDLAWTIYEHHHEMDHLDEVWLGIDRGLGGVVGQYESSIDYDYDKRFDEHSFL